MLNQQLMNNLSSGDARQRNYSVAPMEGFTTFPMRAWLSMVSRPKSMTTPFLRVTRTHPDGQLPLLYAPELFELRGAFPYSLTPQLITGDVELFLQTADLLPPDVTPAIELNCGCPSPSCVGKQAGSGILRDPISFGRTIERLISSLGPQRLAIKMRLGLDDPAEFKNLLPHVASLPLSQLTVHGRTRADRYRGKARWDLIQQAAQTSKTPTWASGDVCGKESAAELLAAAPDITGAMIGRGLLRNPWVFEELRSDTHQKISITTLANALLCYALLNDLSITAPEKLIAKMGRGRLVSYCGSDAGAWERTTAELTEMVCRVPMVLSSGRGVPDIRMLQTAFARMRMLWSYLRTSLPEAFSSPKLMRAKTSSDFFSQLFEIAQADGLNDELITLQHHTAWDELFGGTRGTS